ncbi:MAG: hypothetical protein R3247_16060 [Rhodothermales bacterium]|nr:hypothetical protein [Rhodothermales bacterium]
MPSRSALRLLPLLLCLAACGPEAAPPEALPQDLAVRDTVLAVLGRIDDRAFREAFSRLDAVPHTRHIRTTQLDASGRRLAGLERVVRHEDGAHRLLHADTLGAFAFGYLGSFVDADPGTPAPAADWLDALLPEDPAYLAPRNRDAFVYRFRPDTVVAGMPVQAVEIRARAGEGDDQPIRRARLYLDEDAGRLVAFSLHRSNRAFFARETTAVFAAVRPGDGGSWRPHVTRVRTRIDGPFRAPHRFQTASAFYAFGPE